MFYYPQVELPAFYLHLSGDEWNLAYFQILASTGIFFRHQESKLETCWLVKNFLIVFKPYETIL